MSNAKEKTTRQIYRWMANTGSRIWETDLMGQTILVISESHIQLVRRLADIEAFVEDVTASDLPAYQLKEGVLGKDVIDKLSLSRHARAIVKFPFYQFPHEYQYSCRVQLFMRCWKRLKLDEEGFRQLRGASSQLGKEPYELFNALIALIRSQSKTIRYMRKAYDRENHAKRNCQSATKYITALYKLDVGLQVLRFEFFYRPALAPTPTAAKAKKDLKRFLNNRRGKPTLFAGCVGYLWVLHHGLEKGWHIHLICFYAGNSAHAKSTRPRDIGYYWNNAITCGQGQFWLWNEIPNNGIDPRLLPEDYSEQQRRLLLNEVRNLIESEQYLRPAKLEGERFFGKGERKQISRPRSDGAF